MVTTVAFDQGNPAISDQLHEWGQRLRSESQLAYSEAYGGFYIASRHADISAITRNTESFTSAQGITIPPLANPVPSIPAESDEPMHRHYRAVLQSYLTLATVRQREEDIRALITQTIDAFIEKGEADLIGDLAAQIPTRAAALMFGFDHEEATRFDQGFRAVVASAGSDVDTQMRAVGDFIEFLKGRLEDRRKTPADDVISAMIDYDADGRKFTEDECLGLLWSVAGAATDTTRHAIGHALYYLHETPGLRERVLDDTGSIPAVVEESLRLEAPAYMIGRVVAKEVTISGTRLKPGDRVLLVYGWANRDESLFEDPNDFIVGRKNVMQHCTFGKGMHSCLGLHLARLEVRLVLEQVLRRLPDYRLTDKPNGPTLAGGLMWGFETLPAKFTEGAPLGSK